MAGVNSASPTLVDIVETKAAVEKPKSSSVSAWCSAQWRAILAELVSTAMLLLFGCMANIPIAGLSEHNPIYGPLGFGFTVLFNIQIFGHLSGAHMNPAVTLCAVIWGSVSVPLGILYVIAQILGATIGFGILVGLAHMDVVANGICVTIPHLGLSSFQALGIEIVLTGALCFLNCAVWDPINKHKQDSVPIKFALAIVGLSLAGGPLTGASMNPARSLGPAIWTGIWTAHWTYWAGPFLGAILTTIFYKVIFLQNEKQV